MVLAPGVSFDEDKHEYWYKGKRLSGVTGLISKKLELKYSREFVGEHAEEGIYVHKAIQRWIETGKPDSIHPGVVWLTETFRKQYPEGKLYSEALVSDFDRYASAVDIILDTGNGLIIFDVKKGTFKREYTTWQLSVYKYFIETSPLYAPHIVDCVCICLKDKEYYPIFPKPVEDIQKLLY
jgi:hypothetical protein